MTDQTDIKLTSTRQIKHSTPTNDSYYRKIATNTSTSSTPVRQTHKIDSKVSLPSKVFDFIGLNDTPNRKYSKEYLLAQFDDKFLIPTGSTILDAIAVRQRNPNPNLIPLQSYNTSPSVKKEIFKSPVPVQLVQHDKEKSLDLWDTPKTSSGVGGFDSGGFFSNINAVVPNIPAYEPSPSPYLTSGSSTIMKPSTHPLLDLNPPDMSLFNEIYKTPQMDQITPGQPATIIDESFSPFQRESPLDTSTSFDKIGLFSPFKKEVKQSDPEVHQPNSIFDSFAKRTSLLTTAVPQFSLFQQELHSGFNSNFNPVDVKSNTIMDSHSNDNTNRFESYGSSVMKNTKQPIITLNSQQEMSFQNIPRTHSAMLIQNVEPFMPPQWMYRDLSGQIQGPFSPFEMQEWMDGGYFPDDLPIMHQKERKFTTVTQLKQLYGTRPFIHELKELENKYIAHSNRIIPQITHFPTTTTNFTTLDTVLNQSVVQSKNVSIEEILSTVPSVKLGETALDKTIPHVKAKRISQNNALQKVESELNRIIQVPTTNNLSGKRDGNSTGSQRSQRDTSSLNKEEEEEEDEPVLSRETSSILKTKPAWNSDLKHIDSKVSLLDIQATQDIKSRLNRSKEESRKEVEMRQEARRLLSLQAKQTLMQTIVSEGSPWGNTSFQKEVDKKQSLLSIMKNENYSTVTDIPQTKSVGNAYGNAARSTFPQQTTIKSAASIQGKKPVSENTLVEIVVTESPWSDSQKDTAIKSWAKKALSAVGKASHIDIDGFVSMLLSISLNETITFYQICDDTLVGIHAINPRKFADEFLRLRRQNLIETKATGREKEVLSTFDTGNRFQTVSSRKKKNK